MKITSTKKYGNIARMVSARAAGDAVSTSWMTIGRVTLGSIPRNCSLSSPTVVE